MYEDIQLHNDNDNHSFELFVDGNRAFIDYKQREGVYFLIHTEVPVELEGHGIAAALVNKVFLYLEDNGFKMVPYCAYIKAYLKKHPEWERLLSA